MILKIVLVILALASVNAFTKVNKVSNFKTLKMSAEGLVGSLPPTGYFDPLGLSNNKDEKELKRWRESEIKHGRVAMLASVGIITAEKWNPLFQGKILGAGIYHFQQADSLLPYFWTLVLFSIALVEGQNILTGWESPREQTGQFKGGKVAYLKSDYIPGDLGFDPLGIRPKDPEEFDIMYTKELQNGRLAMLGVAGIVAQELVNGKGILDNLGR